MDIAKANGVEQLINEASRTHPELTVLASYPLIGISARSVVYTGASNTNGSFRKLNAGIASITEISEERLFQCFTAEPRIEEDRAIADRYDRGALAWTEEKSVRILDLEMLAWSRQMYRGSLLNVDGFPGLIQAYDKDNMVIDAGGTTNNACSSVWLIRAAAPNSPADDGVRWRFGNGGQMRFDDVRPYPFADPADPTRQKYLMKYMTTFTAYPGIQMQTMQSVGRIKRLTEEAGKGLTDNMLNRALELFPAGKGPNCIFMTLRSARQLQSSRTATNPTGTPAPWATSIVGINGQTIPIYVTEALDNTEPLNL